MYPKVRKLEFFFYYTFSAIGTILKTLVESVQQPHSESKLKKILQEFVEYLPGPMTPQKYTKLDDYSSNYSQVIKVYSQVLKLILEHLQFNDYIDLISPIFAPEGGTLEMLSISLDILWKYVNVNALSLKTDFAIELFMQVVMSDLIKSVLILETLNTNHSQFTVVMECLLSLPIRLANKVGQNIPKLLTPVEFSNRIMYHILCVIDQLSQYYIFENKKPNTKPLTILLGMTVTSSLQNDFSTTLNILECWCLDNNYAVIIRSILSDINRRAVDRLGYLFCHKLSTPASLHNLIGDAIIDMPNWKHTLCNKMIFFFYHEDNNIVFNLMNYLYLVQKQSNRNVLSEIILELLVIWNDKSSLIHIPFEQHYYISKLIVLGTKLLSEIMMDKEFKETLKNKLFDGFPAHLQSSEQKVRAIGMIVAELIIGIIKSNETDEPKLNFEYDKMQEESKLIVKTLKELTDINTGENKLQFDNAFKMLNNFFEGSDTIKSKSSGVIATSHNNSLKLKSIDKKKSKKKNLDSDDDEFEPYDLSNDVPMSVKNRPKYVRDLISGLNEQKDYNVWHNSLEASENLIKSQLPNDDVSFAIELLTLLISMDKQFYSEQFYSLRYQSAVAVVTVYPYDCAKHLCSLFYNSIGKYAVSHRILILDVLIGSAKELSGFKNVEEKQKEEPMAKVNTNYWADVIKNRIQKKTRIISNPKAPSICQANKFAPVADAFFFPLIRGNLTRPIISSEIDRGDNLNGLGVHLINSLSIILRCAANSQHATSMATELLEWTWSLRYHEDVEVRIGVMSCVAAALVSVPLSRLDGLMRSSLGEFIMWLQNVVTSEGILNKVDNEVNKEARQFAINVLILYDDISKDFHVK